MRAGGLITPRRQERSRSDLVEPAPLMTRQRVGRTRRRRNRARWGGRVAAGAGTLALAAGLAAAGHWAFTTPRLAVASVTVEGASRVSRDRILAAAAIAPGTNILRIDPAAVTARLEALVEIRRAEIIRELPDRLTIRIEERRPFTLVHAGRLHWLDEEARLIGAEAQAVVPPAPVISGLSDEELAAMRSAPGPKARAAISLVRALVRSGSALSAEISEIDMSRREGPVLYTLDGIEVRLGTEQWEERLARLEGVLGQLAGPAAMAGGPVTAVDLRFRDQVVLQRGGQR
jgi:cell division protein FtsQ